MARTPDSELHPPVIATGVYRHYRGDLYEVLGVSLDTETLESYVIYKPLYESNVSFWTRPYGIFTEEVFVDGSKIPRFKKEDENV